MAHTYNNTLRNGFSRGSLVLRPYILEYVFILLSQLLIVSLDGYKILCRKLFFFFIALYCCCWEVSDFSSLIVTWNFSLWKLLGCFSYFQYSIISKCDVIFSPIFFFFGRLCELFKNWKHRFFILLFFIIISSTLFFHSLF